MTPLKIGQLSVYFGLFDDAMPAGFRQTRRDYAAAVGDMLAAYGEVVAPGLVDNLDSAAEANEAFVKEGVDVVVFAPTMAAPPGWAARALDGLDVPVVVLGAQESGTVPDDYDTETATARSLPVGLVMFTNVLVRRRPEVGHGVHVVRDVLAGDDGDHAGHRLGGGGVNAEDLGVGHGAADEGRVEQIGVTGVAYEAAFSSEQARSINPVNALAGQAGSHGATVSRMSSADVMKAM